MRADLIHAPDLTDEEQEALTPEELDVWLAAAARFNLRLECEWLWARRQPCSACGAPATWHYDPAEGTPESRWRCDTCIHRGCSCMASAAYDAAHSDVPQSEADLPPFDPERDGLRLADGRLSPCMEWHAFTDPATLPAVGDLAGWAARTAAGLVP
jgi:hypothetical protein